MNRLTQLTNRDSSNAIIEQYNYTLAPAGQRTQVAEASGRIVDYSYDDTYKLLQEQVTDSVRGNRTTSFTYDNTGNRQSQTDNGVTTSYTYDDNDRLTSESNAGVTTTYSYDENGNTLTRVRGADTTTYTYDHENRLLTSSRTEGNNTNSSSYTYDADGIRQSKTEAGQTTNYLIDPNRNYAQVLEERDGSNLLQVAYTYGDDLISQSRSGNTSTYHYDGLGSTRALTDSTGNTLNSYHYSAFGDIEHQTGTTENEYLFTGEQYDPNLGYYYLRARYYDPTVGRFATMDTFAGINSDPITLHKYLYGNGDPVNLIDPSGNFSIGSIGAALNVQRTLVTISRASFQFLGKKGLKKRLKRKKWQIWIGWKTKVQFKLDGKIPHAFIYAQRIKGRGGFRFDVGAAIDPSEFGGLVKHPFSPVAGGITSRPTNKKKILRSGDRLVRKVTKLTHVQFGTWKRRIIAGDFDSNGNCRIDYQIAGTNCVTWTARASITAVAISKLSFLFP